MATDHWPVGRRGWCGAERGSVVPAMAGVLGVVALVAIGLGHLAQALVERAEAQSAADAAALAGVVEGRAGAADLASRNGAELEQFGVWDRGVTVRVRRGRTEATASAVYDPSGAG